MEVDKLVEVTRGKIVESVHRGVAVVVDAAGKTLFHAGDPSYITYIRSAAKPMQAVPVVESGAAKRFGFTTEELALIMSSHNGEEEHVRVGMQVMEKIGLGPEHLRCGTHPPLHKRSAGELEKKGQVPTVFHCTCSGKHAGMLALARHLGLSLHDYYLPDHPVQKLMLQAVADFACLKPAEIITGTDGCGVPVFALSLERMALAYARWAKPSGFGQERKEACLTLQRAMTSHPFLLAGTGRLASEVMKVTGNKLVMKDGTEGIFCLGVPGKGWGIAIKAEDGHTRALGPVVVEILRQLGLITAGEYERLLPYARQQLKNYRGENVGEVRPAFTLQGL
ncbi:MAG: asparaginase [Peptococcaceae bacterium]|jgi:L-asparaginase II|nr:asparaginase [Peptococcaceae bacterium]MDH7524737.1 asparaginase [Peptococcaceae bacterium]